MAAGDASRLEQEIDRLFELPADRFIAARDELAKRLKSEGRTDDAAKARSLRRPTVAAWAVNQTARRYPAEVRELLEAGRALQQAQRKVLSGVKAGGFREAMERRRAVVSRLAKAAEDLLAEEGHGSAGVAEAVAHTFEAASLDEAAAEDVRAGRLSRELPAPAGFGAAGGLEVVAGTAASEPESAAESRSARASAARRAKELSTTAAQARRAAMKSRADADRLEEKADRLRQEAEETRALAREASKRAREMEAAADRAQSDADRAARRLED